MRYGNRIYHRKLDFADISAGADEKRELDRIRKNVGLMNAEKIYGYLKKTKESEIDRLEKIFRRDDHSFWYPETKNRKDVILRVGVRLAVLVDNAKGGWLELER